MLTREQNELITRTGPGTAMGETLRRYWMPAFTSAELAEVDGAPIRVKLLSEDLVAFRDSEGSVGLVAANCPHRGASLFFGRNEESGLRCVYHGWKFDVEGRCIDMPNEPPESNFKHKVHQVAYPCIEKAGVVWTYMGPPELKPPAPNWEWMRLPDGHVFVSRTFEDCNYLQALEGGVDSSHSSFLHRNLVNLPGAGGYTAENPRLRSMAPRLEIVPTDYGYTYASLRPLPDEGKDFVRVYQFVMPWQQVRYGGGYEGRKLLQGHLWIPIDDHSHWVYNWIHLDDGGPMSEELIWDEESRAGRGREHLLPGFKLKANRNNAYFLSREKQRTMTFTGIDGVNTQDFAVQESMGFIYDRTKEHLGSTDAAVITLRRMLLQAVKDVQEGRDPIGLTGSADYVRAVETKVPMDVPWTESIRQAALARW
jgi:phthalate 4,5-dioxygenase